MNNRYYIYVLQMHTRTVPARIIKFLTQYEYSHVAIALEKDCKVTYSFGRKELSNFLNSGFVEEHQNGPFFRKYHTTKCRIYEIEVSEKQYRVAKTLLEDRKKRAHDYQYDFLGIILRFFNIPVSFDKKSVCSQFVADVLEMSGVLRFEKPSYFVKPQDFDHRKGFKTVYEGSYLAYAV